MEERIIKSVISVCKYSELSDADRCIVDAARNMTEHSYSPYSHFSVGAAVLLENGKIFRGCNQENAAFGVTICAERTALFAAGAECPHVAVNAIAIAARNVDNHFTEEPVAPCGSCRQALIESEIRGQHPIHIILCGKDKFYIMEGIRHLMPLAFTDF